MSFKGMKTHESFILREWFAYALVQHIVSLLLDRHFVPSLPPQLLLFVSDDDEDVVRRDMAHLLIVLFVRIWKEINNISQNGTTLGSGAHIQEDWKSCAPKIDSTWDNLDEQLYLHSCDIKRTDG